MMTPRNVTRSRLLLLLLAALYCVWAFAFGILAGRYDREEGIFSSPLTLVLEYLALLPVIIVKAYFFSRWIDIAANSRVGLSRLLALLELLWAAFLVAGLPLGYARLDFSEPSQLAFDRADQRLILALAIFIPTCLVLVLLISILSRPGMSSLPQRRETFFLWNRSHVAGRESRSLLLAGSLLFGIAAAYFFHAVPIELPGQVIEKKPTDIFHLSRSGVPPFLIIAAWGFLVGSACVIVQGHWHRAIGFVPWAFGILALSLVVAAISPGTKWVIFPVGVALGLGHIPITLGLMAWVSRRQRFAAALINYAAKGLSLWLIFNIVLMPFSRFEDRQAFLVLAILAIVATCGITYLLFRPFVELINELVFRVLWYPVAYGPGKYGLSTRGPALIVGNHAAMFDPVWLSAVIPLRNRAMMISTILDKPFLKWLCGRVYQAIRVPSEGFRRNAPEIEEAIAALREGDTVMIFPEGWLRRKEEQPLRRFANGVHRILSQCPDTPVITCWIEDGWGSWTSWKNGPPGKNKPKDIVKKIRIGINEAEILPPEMLKDHIATRRYLMQRVLHARTHLGLPEFPMPSFGLKEEKEE